MMYGVRQFWASTVRPYVRYVIVRKIRTCTAFGLSLAGSDLIEVLFTIGNWLQMEAMFSIGNWSPIEVLLTVGN